MKRPIAFALLALCLAPSLAIAATFPIPAENPIATVSIPDGWGPNAYEGGVEGTSADGKLYVAFESVDADDVKRISRGGYERRLIIKQLNACFRLERIPYRRRIEPVIMISQHAKDSRFAVDAFK